MFDNISVAVFLIKTGENHVIINIVSEGRAELVSCPNVFVGDCRYVFNQRNKNV